VAHDQATITVMLFSREILVSSRIGSRCSDWLQGLEEVYAWVRWRVKETYDVAHEVEDAEVVGLAQTIYALVDILWMEAMISQAGQEKCSVMDGG
jgi:hypothetical protein